MRSPRAPRSRPFLEDFEPRLLYSADHPASLIAAALAAPPAAQGEVQLVFIDSRVDKGAQLQADIAAQAAAGRPIEAIVLDPNLDGLTQISAALAARSGIGAIHLITHGSEGEVQLGSTTLDNDTLLQRAGEIAAWRGHLGADADLLLYGCDVGAGSAGQALVQGLAQLSGACVAASDDATGHRALGGDWSLEVATGHIDAQSAIDAAGQAAWMGLLAADTAPTLRAAGTGTRTVADALGLVGQSVAVQPDGKILLAGTIGSGTQHKMVVYRFNADGSADTSFNASGGVGAITVVAGTSDCYANGMALQADGKIVLVGSSSANGNKDFFVARLNADGTLETGFNGGVAQIAGFGSGDDVATSVAIDGNNKIVAAGYAWNGSNFDFAAIRYNTNGTIDTGFNGTGKASAAIGTSTDQANGVIVQADGRIVLVGTTWNGSNNDISVVRLTSAGALDTTFAGTGKFTIAGTSGGDDLGQAVVQQGSNLLIAGSITSSGNTNMAVVRLTSAGAIDTSFGTSGVAKADLGATDVANGIALQADGKIVVAGSSNAGATSSFGVARWNSDGSVDTGFSGDGQDTVSLDGGIDSAASLSIGTDNKIVIAGTAGPSIGFVRYSALGSIDDSLGAVNPMADSVAYTENGAPVVLNAAATVSDAELDLAGHYAGATLTLARAGAANAQDVFSATGSLAALVTGGSLNYGGTVIGSVTQNSGGTLVLAFNGSATQALVNSAIRSLAYTDTSDAPPPSVSLSWVFSDGNSGAQGSGGALSASSTTTVNIAAIDDAPVLSTHGSGVVLSDSGGTGALFQTTVVQADGKVLAAGYCLNGSVYEGVVSRYDTDGSLDTRFGTGGVATFTFGGPVTAITGLALQSNGRIAMTGGVYTAGNYDPFVSRLLADGTLDTSFATAGWSRLGLGSGTDVASSVAIDGNGKLVITGFSGNDVLLARYDGDGSLDTGFGTNGVVTTAVGSGNSQGNVLALMPDGRIVVVGSTAVGATFNLLALRYTSTGSLDASFDGDGIAVLAPGTHDSYGTGVALLSGGGLLIGGQDLGATNHDMIVLRLTAAGVLDTSFGVNGIASADFGTDDGGNAMVVQTDGKIVVGGFTTGGDQDAAVARWNADGSLDTSFNGSSKAVISLDAGVDAINAMALTPDGHLVAVGQAGDRFAVARFDSAGALDPSFGSAVSYLEDAAPVVLSSFASLLDAELDAANDDNGASLSLQRHGSASADDRFSASGNLSALIEGGALAVAGTTIGSVTKNSAGMLVLSFDGSATSALVTAALRQIAYANTNQAPPASVQIDWAFNDGNSGAQGSGGALIGTDISTLAITAVNDAPGLTGTIPVFAPITEDDATHAGQTVAAVFGSTLTDADAGALTGIAITGFGAGNGHWEYSTDNAGSWTSILSAQASAALLLRSSDLLRFIPDGKNATTASISYRAWDQTSGIAGSVADTTSNGGTTSFSTALGGASIAVSAVNDAPQLTPIGPSLTSIAKTQVTLTGNPGRTVASFIGGSIADVDSGSLRGIAITAASAGGGAGTWQYSIDGSTWWNIGPVGPSASLLLRPTDSVRFQPDGATGTGGVNASLGYRAWDQSSGTAGTRVDSSGSGGTTAFSTGTDTVSLSVSSVDQAPVFGTPGPGSTATDVGPSHDDGNATVVQPDGKVLVAGRSDTASGAEFSLARYHADGSLDTGFGSGGTVTFDALAGQDDFATSIALQADGKIVLGGFASNGSNSDFALLRFHADGTLDTGFGTNGLVLTDFGAGNDAIATVLIQSDGEILATGSATVAGNLDFGAARYHADGSLDTGFGTGGKTSVAIAANADDTATGAGLQSDGKIVIGGDSIIASQRDFSLARLNADGSLDTSFGSAGKQFFDFGDTWNEAFGLAIQADDKIVIAGETHAGGTDDFALARLTAAGALDTGFNGSGTVVTDVASGDDHGRGVTIQSDGKIIVVGSVNRGGQMFGAARYNSDGSLDTSFGNGGKLMTDLTTANDEIANAVAVTPGGTIYLAGSGTPSSGGFNDFMLASYTSAGALDVSWGASSGLATGLAYTENAAPGVMAAGLSVFDAELAAADTYHGASLRLVRDGGASAQDVFSATGALGSLVEGGALVYGGVTIGTVTTNSGGTLLLSFDANATQARVDGVITALAYANGSDAPPASVRIDWTFSDGNSGNAQGSGGALTASGTTVVTITAVDDPPVGTSSTVTLLEDGSRPFAAADFGFSDPDTGDSLSALRIDSLPAAGTLLLSGVAVSAGQVILAGALGNLVFTPAPNANGAAYAGIGFSVRDQGGAYDLSSKTLTMAVTSVNDAPSGASKTVTALEDTAYVFSPADFGFDDASDMPANALRALVVTTVPAAGSLTLNGVAVTAGQSIGAGSIASGLLRFQGVTDANGAGYASLAFLVQDDGGVANGGADTDPTSRTITIDIAAVDDAPSGASKTVTTLEDTAYTFGTSDFGFRDPHDAPADALLAVTITTLPATGGLTLDGITVTPGQSVLATDIAAGLLTFTPALNAHGAGDTSFTFQVRDNGGTANGGVDLDPTPRTMSVDVTAVNDAPSGASQTVTTLEDSSYTFATADFGFGDASDTPANTLTAVTITTLPGAGSLELNGHAATRGQSVLAADIAAGLLTFTPMPNHNGAAYASFAFQVQDNGGTANGGVDLDPTPRTMSVRVTSVNDAPSGASQTVTTLEDTAYTFGASDFGFSDSNDTPADTLLAVTITTLPGAGSLKLDGSAVTLGQSISAATITAGSLTFTPAANANGAGCASFTFQVRDTGGTANGGVDLDPTPRTMSVDVIAVNDAPSGTSHTVTTLEDTAYTFGAADFGFSDPSDAPAHTLMAVRITTLPRAGSLKLNGSTVALGQSVSAAHIAAGLLTFTPAPNANGAGYASFTFQVQDDGGTANGGVDTDPTARTMSVDVTSVNDAPSGASKTVTTLEDTPYTFDTADFGFSDGNDSPANALSAVALSTVPGTGTLKLGGVAVTAGQSISAANIAAGLLTFTPDHDANGASNASFGFRARDDGLTANGGVDLDPSVKTMTIAVTSINDAPSGTDQTVTASEDAPYVFSATDFGFSDASDTPANAFSALIVTTVPFAGSLTLDGIAVTAGESIGAASIASGLLRFQAAPGANGANSARFTFQVQDNGGTTNGGADTDATPRTITIDVTAVNDAPSGASKTVTTLEDTAYVVGTADFGFSDANDAPANTLLAVTITSLPGAGRLALGGAAVSLGQSVLAADIAAGLLAFTPAPNANGAGDASFTFQVQDDGGTANGGIDLDPTARTITVDIVPVNDAPVLTAVSPALATLTEDDLTNAGQPVSSFLGHSIHDADAGASEGIAITAASSGNGHWQYSLDDGSQWSALGPVGDGSARLLRASDWLRFVPDGRNGTVAALGYRAWDQSSGSAGALADARVDGGRSAFSLGTDAVSINVSSVNDAPVLTPASPTWAPLAADDLNDAGQTVASLLDTTLGDVDDGAEPGIALIATDAGNGRWQFALGSGAWQDLGPVSEGAGWLLRANDRLRFVPDGQDATHPRLRFRGWDQTTGTAGSAIAITATGGTTAFSTVSDSASLDVTAVNAALRITSNGGGDRARIHVPENDAVVTTIQATAPGRGPGLLYRIAGGADAALFQIDAASGALRFITAPDYEAPRDAGADNLYDLIVEANSGASSDSQTLAVEVTPVNDNTPRITGPGLVLADDLNARPVVVTASDADLPAQRLRFSIAGGPGASHVTIDAQTGALHFIRPDPNARPEMLSRDRLYDVQINVSDGELSQSRDLKVVVFGNTLDLPVPSAPARATFEVAALPRSKPMAPYASSGVDDEPWRIRPGLRAGLDEGVIAAPIVPQRVVFKPSSLWLEPPVSHAPSERTGPRSDERLKMLLLQLMQPVHRSGSEAAPHAPVVAEPVEPPASAASAIFTPALVGGLALSAGLVAWASRGGALLASLAVSAPAWRSFDLLPVLHHRGRHRRGLADGKADPAPDFADSHGFDAPADASPLAGLRARGDDSFESENPR